MRRSGSRIDIHGGDIGYSGHDYPPQHPDPGLPGVHATPASLVAKRPWTPEETDRSDASSSEEDGDLSSATSLVYIYKPSRDAKCGITFVSEPQSQPGLLLRHQEQVLVYVSVVLRGGLADEAGLAKDDGVASINGVPARSASRCAQILKDAHGTIEIAVRRGSSFRSGDPLADVARGTRGSAKVVPLEMLSVR